MTHRTAPEDQGLWSAARGKKPQPAAGSDGEQLLVTPHMATCHVDQRTALLDFVGNRHHVVLITTKRIDLLIHGFLPVGVGSQISRATR